MARQLTNEDGRQSLQSHVAAKGADVREKYGPEINWVRLLQILDDRTITRYPCEIVFDATSLEPGEFAYPKAKGEDPAEGFTIYVHPHFRGRLDEIPWLVLYQLVLVNYGDFASSADAEIFASSALGLPREDYYQALCAMADEIPAPAAAASCPTSSCH